MIKDVLFVSSVYKPNIGGVETAIEELTGNFTTRGMTSRVLTKRFPKYLSDDEQIANIRVLRFNRPILDIDYLKLALWLKQNESVLMSDIVHVMGVRRPMPLFGALLAKRWNAPLVVNFVGGDVPDPTDPETQKSWDEGAGVVIEPIKQAEALISFSKSTAELARRSIPQLRNIDIVYAGLDIGRIDNAIKMELGYEYFLCARRLVPDKGVDVLIRAFASVKNKVVSEKLIIAGDGPERSNLEAIVSNLDLKDKVIFIGEIGLDELFSYMKGAIAHVCPSRAEGGGTVNFEAQAAGCVAIGTKVGGIPEYIKDGETGILVNPEDINDLASTLVRVNGDKKLRKTLVDQAKNEIKQFSWEKIGDQYLGIYTQAFNSLTNFTPWSDLSNNMWNLLK